MELLRLAAQPVSLPAVHHAGPREVKPMDHGMDGSVQGQPARPSAAEALRGQLDPEMEEAVQEMAEAFGEVVARANRGLEYHIDDMADLIVTEIINRQTREVIRQIPAEELVDLTRRVRQAVGLILDVEV